MANVSFNPAVMTAAQNTFLVSTEGFIQGIPLDDWVSGAWNNPGIVASGVTQPVWGGMGVTVASSVLSSTGIQGQSIGLATTTEIHGFTTFDRGINMIQTPGNTVAIATAGSSIPFFLFGSNVRLPLPIASGTLANFENAAANIPLYWDTAALCLTTVSSTTTVALPATVKLYAVNTDNSKMVSYNSTTQAVIWVYAQPSAVIVL